MYPPRREGQGRQVSCLLPTVFSTALTRRGERGVPCSLWRHRALKRNGKELFMQREIILEAPLGCRGVCWRLCSRAGVFLGTGTPHTHTRSQQGGMLRSQPRGAAPGERNLRAPAPADEFPRHHAGSWRGGRPVPGLSLPM